MTPFKDQVDDWQKDMERLLHKAKGWGAHVKVNGNQDLNSMTIDVIIAPPMIHKDVNVRGD